MNLIERATVARKVETIVTLTDDLDGSKADRTISFTIEGTGYEIDLSKKNAAAFEKALAPYVSAARRAPKVGSSRARLGRGATKGSEREHLLAVRAWARAKGLAVSDRGRIPQSIRDAYDAEH